MSTDFINASPTSQRRMGRGRRPKPIAFPHDDGFRFAQPILRNKTWMAGTSPAMTNASPSPRVIRRKLAVALAAVEQMRPHGGARAPHRLCADRLDDGKVLLLERAQVGDALGRAARDANGLA